MSELATARLNDLKKTFLLNKETALRTLDKSKGQPTIPSDDVKLILMTLLANDETQQHMIQELNDLLIAERKKKSFGFTRLFKK